jgi:hypothetical protein
MRRSSHSKVIALFQPAMLSRNQIKTRKGKGAMLKRKIKNWDMWPLRWKTEVSFSDVFSWCF